MKYLVCAALLAASSITVAQQPAASPAVASPANPPRPLGDVSLWVTMDDYPPEALAAGHEGVVAVELRIAPLGFVQDCTVTQTSGFAELDAATCTALRSHAFFTAATDAAGRNVEAVYPRRVRWQLPQPVAPTPPAPGQ